MRGFTVTAFVAGERDLLADDRSEVRVEGEDELLELLALRVVQWKTPAPRKWKIVSTAAVVEEAHAADLRPLVRQAAESEHADLLIGVAQVRDLEHLGLALEGPKPSLPKKPCAGFRVWQPLQLKRCR